MSPLKPRRVPAFDLDGTLLDHPNGPPPPGPAWRDPTLVEALVPHPVALRRTLAEGPAIFICGRDEPVRAALRRKLDSLGLYGDLFLQQAFTTPEALVRFKATVLRAEGATYYVGDSEHDREAAKLAKVPFIPAAQWRDAQAIPEMEVFV